MIWVVALLVGAFASAPTAPTNAPTPFVIPTLPISKANAQYPDCRTEIIFVLDVSASVTPTQQVTLMRFAVQFMVEVEKNVKDARFAVVVFGIYSANTTAAKKRFDTTPFGGPMIVFDGPLGNRLPVGSELALGLDRLRYNCTECMAVNANFSQLQYMWTLGYSGDLTPTWDGLDIAKAEYDNKGDQTVPGRFIVLLTDGVPNVNGCGPTYNATNTNCIRDVGRTDGAVANATQGTLLITVGIRLDNVTRNLMIRWASEPKDILAIPDADYSVLQQLIPKLLSVLCPAGSAVDCLAEGATDVDIIGSESNVFLNTPTLGCRFFREDPETSSRYTKAILVNATWIKCPLPSQFFPGTWNLQYTIDGRGYYDGAVFRFGTICSAATANHGGLATTAIIVAVAAVMAMWQAP